MNAYFWTRLILFVGGALCTIELALVVRLFYRKIILPERCIKNAKQTSKINTQAVVISKTMKIRPAGYASKSDMYLVFELPDGTRKDFRVDTSAYNTILEGEEGILTYHEKNDTRVFVSFQRTR